MKHGHRAQGLLSGQMDNGLPNVEIGLIELLSGEFDGYPILAGQNDLFHELSVFALDCSEQRRANKAVGCAALGFGPQWKLDNRFVLAFDHRTTQSLQLLFQPDVPAFHVFSPRS